MKKMAVLAVLCGVLFGFASFAKAEGIEAGSRFVSGYLGASAPLQDSGMKEYGTDLDWADAGVSLGASYVYFVNEHFGLGAELSGSVFAESEYDFYSAREWENVKTSMALLNAMAVARVNINPYSRVRVYIPFGLGITSAEGRVKLDGYESGYYYKGELKENTTSFGYFAGVGVEADLGQSNWVLGGEVRYSGFQFDTDKFFNDGDGAGKKNYSYLSFLAKVGYKF